MKTTFRGIHPDDVHGRMGLRNPERGFRTEMYFSHIPGEIAGTCSCHIKQMKLDGRSEKPVYQNASIPNVPHLIRGNRLDGVEFSHWNWQDEIDYFSYDGVTIMQSYCFLMKYNDGRDIPQEKLDDIEDFFLKVRRAGVKCLLRFAYELSPTLTGPTAETTLKHLSQLAPMINKYIDVIYVLQLGFVGKFGEWHNSYHALQSDLAFRKELFAAVLDVLPPQRRTMVRYPVLKMAVYGTEPLTEDLAFTMDPKARIGHFDDGFMAKPRHGGTFGRGDDIVSIDRIFDYFAKESKYLPQDGELFWSDVAGTALPTETTVLLRNWHFDTLGFVHGNSAFEGADTCYSIDVWKRVPVDPMFLEREKLPISDGYFTDEYGKFVWRSYYEYIRDHIGYRLELQTAEAEVAEGRLRGKIVLINRGFSSPVNPRKAYLRVDGKSFELKADLQRWFAGETQTLEFDIPAAEAQGKRLGLWLPDDSPVLRDRPEYAIRCANDIEFSDGVNWLGEL